MPQVITHDDPTPMLDARRDRWTAAPAQRPACEISSGYTRLMAKVLISLPDDLLERIDREADVRGSNRSRFLQEALLKSGLGRRPSAVVADLTRST